MIKRSSEAPVTDVTRLATEISEKSFEAALPHQLSDAWLKKVVSELVKLKRSLDTGIEANVDLEAPLLLVLRIIEGKGQTSAECLQSDVGVMQLLECFMEYKYWAEAELAARAAEVATETARPSIETIFEDIFKTPRDSRTE